jgi:hypothetical protein
MWFRQDLKALFPRVRINSDFCAAIVQGVKSYPKQTLAGHVEFILCCFSEDDSNSFSTWNQASKLTHVLRSILYQAGASSCTKQYLKQIATRTPSATPNFKIIALAHTEDVREYDYIDIRPHWLAVRLPRLLWLLISTSKIVESVYGSISCRLPDIKLRQPVHEIYS